jgi:hypothetical protein
VVSICSRGQSCDKGHQSLGPPSPYHPPNRLPQHRYPLFRKSLALEIGFFIPLWLQRQRLLLELLYHFTLTSLHRPFIRFSPFSPNSTPISDSHAITALSHAISGTNMLHQILSETDILAGWNQACQYQWNATLSIIGFALAYPVCPPTPSALKALNSATSCL